MHFLAVCPSSLHYAVSRRLKHHNFVATHIATFDHTRIHRHASILKSFHILFGGFWPTLLHVWPLGFVGQEIEDGILASNLSLEVDDGLCGFDFFLHGDEVDVETALAKFLLKLDVCYVGDSFEEDLHRLVAILHQFFEARKFDRVAHLFEISDVTLIAGLLEVVPCCFRQLVGNVMHGQSL